MNKIVKVLLVILAILIIAGAGFWGGTQFAYRQVAANTANLAATNSSQTDGYLRGPGMMGYQPNSRNWSNDDNSERGSRGQDNFGPGRNDQGNRGPQMMQPNNFGHSMMQQSHGGFSGGIFGGGLMLLGLIFPLGILVLIVLGIIALFQVVKRSSTTVSITGSNAVCPKCGSIVQTGWKHCATCGKALE